MQTKADHSDDEAIIDDVAGQAYIEQFGNETFERAERAVHANKASKYESSSMNVLKVSTNLLPV